MATEISGRNYEIPPDVRDKTIRGLRLIQVYGRLMPNFN